MAPANQQTMRRFSVNYALLSCLLDGLLVALCLVSASLLRPALNRLPGVLDLPTPVLLPAPFLLIFPAVWLAVGLALNLYDPRRNVFITDELSTHLTTAWIGLICMAGILYLSARETSRAQFLLFFAAAYLSTLGWRLLARCIFALAARRGERFRPAVIVGISPEAALLYDQVLRSPELGLQIIGYLDDQPGPVGDLPLYLGGLASLRQVIAERRVQDVFIALGAGQPGQVEMVVTGLADLAVNIRLVAAYSPLALHRPVAENWFGLPVFDLRAPAITEFQRLIKRLFDVLAVCLLLPVALPLMGLIALAVRLDSPGPVVLRQPRAGENGRLFAMLKFRTMYGRANAQPSGANAPPNGTPPAGGQPARPHKTRGDPRVTRLGRLLRRASLDELPQFFNILAGEMSLVGPRPELPELVAGYQPWQRRRFAVPQGLTGWWQVNGRSELPLHLNTEYDLYYVDHYSVLLDLQILVKTIWVVIKGSGAF